MPSIQLRDDALTEREKRNLVILEALRRLGPVSRPEISQAVGLNIVTVSNYIEDFLNGNVVFEKEFDVSEGGRRPMLLDINPDAAYVLGVGLNLLNVVGVLMDLKGRVVARSCLERGALDIKEIVRCIGETISAVIKKTQGSQEKIKGIGVGIAGIVNKKNGSIRWPQKVDNNYNYASVYVPLKDVIEKQFGMPVFIENDATAACFGEQWLSLEPEVKNLIYMFSGVGCGIMAGGQIYTGSTGSAGELSIYSPKEKSGFNCPAGNPCFLKRWEIDFGMTDEARAKASELINSKEKSCSRLLELSGGDITKINLRTIFQAAKEHDHIAIGILNRAGVQLGVKLAYLVNLLNPEIVLIGGGLEDAGEVFLNTVRTTVKEWAFEEMSENVRILYSNLGENAVALGAGSLVMRQVFAQVEV